MAFEIEVLRILRKEYDIPSVVDLGDPYKVLVSTIISQRLRDETTEKVSKALFKKCPTVQKLNIIPIRELEKIMKPSGFYRNKSANLKKLARVLIKDFEGEVPDDLSELVSLPGVGRKTAGCVLNYAFGKPAIPVDTHVHRIANRLGWVETKAPEKTDEALHKLIPRKHWLLVNNTFVQFGKDICQSRKPKCWKCPVRKYCGYSNKLEMRN